ncbi:hypothetical protein B0H19DRAFT_247302 [Mycena capillaripes]|nr:hypothetical protein B0H19DRAFT_247302 [Mycena capillaripes]
MGSRCRRATAPVCPPPFHTALTGHFALTIPLLPILRTTALPDTHVRIVNLSSEGSGPTFLPRGAELKCSSAMNRYGNPKLSVPPTLPLPLRVRVYATRTNGTPLPPRTILLTISLQRRLHPCPVLAPRLRRNKYRTHTSYPFLAASFSFLEKYVRVPQPSRTQLAATAREIGEKGLKGAYLVPYAKVSTPSVRALDADGALGRQFWELCEDLVLRWVLR